VTANTGVMTAEEIVRAVAAMNPLDDHEYCAFCSPIPKAIWDSGERHRPDCLWLAAVEPHMTDKRQGAETVQVLRSDVERLVGYFGEECDLDHNGLCQAHTVSADCFVPRLRAALGED
jgi:hypothetical protein